MSTNKPLEITKLHARRIWLNAQRLDTSTPFGGGPEASVAFGRHRAAEGLAAYAERGAIRF
jgi:hypothetical protein